jgi:hypothetical protein
MARPGIVVPSKERYLRFRISNFEFFACDDIRRNGGSAEGLRRGRAVAVAHAIPDEPT